MQSFNIISQNTREAMVFTLSVFAFSHNPYALALAVTANALNLAGYRYGFLPKSYCNFSPLGRQRRSQSRQVESAVRASFLIACLVSQHDAITSLVLFALVNNGLDLIRSFYDRNCWFTIEDAISITLSFLLYAFTDTAMILALSGSAYFAIGVAAAMTLTTAKNVSLQEAGSFMRVVAVPGLIFTALLYYAEPGLNACFWMTTLGLLTNIVLGKGVSGALDEIGLNSTAARRI